MKPTCRFCGRSFDPPPWPAIHRKDHYCSTIHWLLDVWGVPAARLLRLGGWRP